MPPPVSYSLQRSWSFNARRNRRQVNEKRCRSLRRSQSMSTLSATKLPMFRSWRLFTDTIMMHQKMTSTTTSLEDDDEEEESSSCSAVEHQQYMQLNMSGEVIVHRGSNVGGRKHSECGCGGSCCTETDSCTSRTTASLPLPLSSTYDLDLDESVLFQEHGDREDVMQHYSNAVKFANSSRWKSAYEEITLALRCCCEPQPVVCFSEIHGPLYKRLLAFQADVLIQMQDKMAALCIYQYLLSCSQSDSTTSMAPCANLSFICARLCVQLGEYEKAYDYYKLELEYTTSIMGKGLLQSNWQQNQQWEAALARIHHSMAKLSKEGLGDLERALNHYNQALHMEQAVRDNIQENINSLASADNCPFTQQRLQERQLLEVSKQIQSTKQCIGRIYYEQGFLEKAVQATFA